MTTNRRGAGHRVVENVLLGGGGWSQRERFERIFHEEYSAVLAYAVRRADLELAKDAVAQTFLVAWRRREELPDPPRAWLLGVTRRTLADLRRSRSRQDALPPRLARAETVVANEFDESSERTIDRLVVGLALDRLRENDAELLRLVYWDDLSIRHAAESLGCSVTAVKVRLLRARRRFQREVEQADQAGQGIRTHPHAMPGSTHGVHVPTSKEA